MFYCPRCGLRFGADAASSALVCPRCKTEDAVFAPFTSWAFDRAQGGDFGQRNSEREFGSGWGHATEGRSRDEPADPT
jgi:hypothetical protein